MKKTLLLKTMLLLFGLIVGSSSAWADETLTIGFEDATYSDWTLANIQPKKTNSNVPPRGGSYYGNTDGKTTGSVVTKNKIESPQNITFYVSKESTNTTASSWIVKVSSDGSTWTQVGSTQSASSDITRGTWTEVTRDLSSYSNVYVGVFYDGTTAKRCIDDITITYTTGGGGSTPTISASDVPIVYDATAGSIAYTINNEPTPVGKLTAAIKDGTTPTIESFALGTVTGSAVPFTCAANSTTTARTATVTLTYTYDTDKTATKDVTITQAADPNAFNTITDITAPNTAYKVKGTVVATNARGFVIGDGTGYVYTYLNAAPSQSVGDKLSITGTTGSYNHVLQFTSSATIAEASTSNYDGTPAVTVLDAEGIAAYNSGYQLSDYVQFEGELVKKDSNYEITVGTGSSTATTRISYPTTAQTTALDALLNKTVRVKGYFAGFSSSKFTVMLESVEEVIVDAHTLTVSATNGSVEITGKSLISGQCDVAEGAEVTATATANDGYRFVNWTVTGEGSSVSDATDNPTTFTMGTEDATLTANFEAIPTHTVTWSINGTETAEEIMEGEDITFPADPADVFGKTFVGWTETAIEGITDVAPTFVTSATMGDSDLKYYAVYAIASGSGPSNTYALVSDEDDLSDGDKIIIVSTGSYTASQVTYKYTVANGTVNSSKLMDPVDVTISDNKVTSTDVAPITLVAVTGGWKLQMGTQYLNIVPTKNNIVLDDDGAINSISIASDEATIGEITDGNDTRNLVYNPNSGNGRFAYYKSAQKAVSIYKQEIAEIYSGYCTSVPTTATATIPAGKEWITFCSTANLDFTSDITGLEGAYTITAHADKAITLTATKMTGKVKAGTGLLLRAAAVDNTNAQVITIPVAETGDEQTGNMLKGVTEDTPIQPSEGEYTNLGLSNGEFHPYGSEGILAAGKAYLQILTAQMPTGGNNAKLIIVFDGETTGIDNLNLNDNDNFDVNAPMYNLAGQRVNKSYKGVVIVNGKKVVRK